MAKLGTKTGVLSKNNLLSKTSSINVLAPLIKLSKKEIIQKGIKLGVDYSFTNSCYQPTHYGTPCGKCDSCKIREQGFKDAGVKDPLVAKFS